MSSLYSISAEYQRLFNKDELDDNDLAQLESLHDSAEDRFIEHAKYIRNLEAEAASVKAAIDDMKARLESLVSKAESHSKWLAEMMHTCKMDKITKSPLFAIKTKFNPPSVVVLNEELIPENYWREYQPKAQLKLDKTAIKADIDKGCEVPGAMVVKQLKLEIK